MNQRDELGVMQVRKDGGVHWGLKKQLTPLGSLCSLGWKGRHAMEQRLEAALGQL